MLSLSSSTQKIVSFDLSFTKTIDRIIKLLKDGSWHSIDEVTSKSRILPDEVETIIEFLEDINFVILEDQKLKITDDVKEWLNKPE